MDEKRDFFISYNHNDEEWAKWIAGTLEEHGYTTTIQAWDFQPGNNFVLEMQEAAVTCSKTILVLSQNYLDSAYCKTEWSAAIGRDPTGKERTLIPVRIEPIAPPGLLAQIVYIDLCDCVEEDAEAELLKGIQDDTARKRKKPKFPGAAKTTVPKRTSTYRFVFTINEDGVAGDLSPRTRNNMREWFLKDLPDNFEVTVCDERLNVLDKKLEIIRKKIQQEKDLTEYEEDRYSLLTDCINRCKMEAVYKQQACTFFLKGRLLQSYLSRDSYLSLYAFIEKILSFDYWGDWSQKNSNPSYERLIFFTSYSSKEWYPRFDVFLDKEKVNKVIEKKSTWLNRIWGWSFMAYELYDLEKELFREAAIYYYFYLAEQVIYDKNEKIVDNKAAMDLLNYRVKLWNQIPSI